MNKIYKCAFILLLSVLCKFVACDKDDSCIAGLKNFHQCLINKTNNISKKEKKVTDVDDKLFADAKENITTCFKKNSCQLPDFNQTILGANKSAPAYNDLLKLKEVWDSIPKDVQKCLKERTKLLVLEQVNKCFKKKNIEPLNFTTETNQNAFDPASETFVNKTNPLFRATKYMVAVFTAATACRNSQGNKAADSALLCASDVLKSLKGELCQRKTDCLKNTVSSDSEYCQKRGRELRKAAACDCFTDRLQEVSNNLNKLIKDGGEHGWSDLGKILGDGFDYFNEKNPVILAVNECARGIHEMQLDVYKLGEIPLALSVVISGNDRRPVGTIVLGMLLDGSKESLETANIKFTADVLSEMVKRFSCGCFAE